MGNKREGKKGKGRRVVRAKGENKGERKGREARHGMRALLLRKGKGG